ncbi:MAG: TonB family protein [Acidobacteria bacterium]|nr:TonB family protein [Acidobacteriota bacterium]
MNQARTILLLLALLVPYTVYGQNAEEAFLRAAERGDTDAVRALLAKGVNVNARDEMGMTALMYAARSGQSEMVKVLLIAGIDVDAKDDDGMTALMYAAQAGSAEVVKILLAAGANPDVEDNTGMTALLKAQTLGLTKIVELLSENEGNREYGAAKPHLRHGPQILSRPRPDWTEEAKRDHVQGDVVLSAVFGADGVVREIRVIRGLGYGLDEKAVEAVQKIQFLPAQDSQG